MPWSQEYVRYMRSEAWYRRRRLYLLSVGYECEVCHSPYSLDVHHRTYKRLGAERDSDLEALCRYCHEVKEKHKRN